MNINLLLQDLKTHNDWKETVVEINYFSNERHVTNSRNSVTLVSQYSYFGRTYLLYFPYPVNLGYINQFRLNRAVKKALLNSMAAELKEQA